MSVALLIAIIPPKKVVKNIEKLRSYITKKLRKNIYGSHEPHVTLFVNSFPNFSNVEKQVVNVVKHYKPFYAKIEGIHTFVDDPIFKSHNIVYKVERTPELVKLQKNIIKRLNPLRTDDQVK